MLAVVAAALELPEQQVLVGLVVAVVVGMMAEQLLLQEPQIQAAVEVAAVGFKILLLLVALAS